MYLQKIGCITTITPGPTNQLQSAQFFCHQAKTRNKLNKKLKNADSSNEHMQIGMKRILHRRTIFYTGINFFKQMERATKFQTI